MNSTAALSFNRDSVATINPRWLPWLRALWVFVALNSVFGIAWTIYLTRRFTDNLSVRVSDGLRAIGWTDESYFWFNSIVIALYFIGYAVVGIAIFLLRPRERMAWLASIFLISFGAQSMFPTALEFAALYTTAPLVYRVAYFINNLFSFSLFFVFFGLFPDGRFVPRWMRYIAAYWFLFCALWGAFPDAFANAQGLFGVWVYGSAVLMFGAGLYAQVWRYRNYATPLQKQQTKWLIFALATIILFIFIIGAVIYLVLAAQQMSAATSLVAELIYFVANLSFLFLPFAIAIAIVRYRLWDIDILIRKTLTYALVVALLAIVYFGSIILLQQIFASIVNTQGNEIITVISTLAIAALFIPVRNRIQELIDKRFYRKKYDAQQVLQKFSETVRDETDLDKLTAESVNVVNETMQPTSVSVWLKKMDDERPGTPIERGVGATR